MDQQKFTFELPCTAEYCDVARLATASVAREANFPEDVVEDIRTAVSEACINVIQHAYDNQIHPLTLNFVIHPTELEIRIEDKGKGFDVEKMKKKALPLDPNAPRESGYGLLIMQKTMDRVEFSSGDSGSCVTLIKTRS